jgi:arginyl-tRNA synthetase
MEETDTKTIPPCIVRKSDGAALYATSDLATIIQRNQDYHPDEIIYVADNRQEMHFHQVFRVAKKAALAPDTKLTFHGFGTMNGKDGKPFKTREGGVMRLEHLIASINDAVYAKIMENRTMSEEDAKRVSRIVGLSALKYGDLSNQSSKDYIFDIDRFSSFEGNTGPYILYTIVRIKSILEKYAQSGKDASAYGGHVNSSQTPAEKALLIELVKFNATIAAAYDELAPHKICAYIYDLSNAFNKFYHENNIMGEEDAKKQAGFINLLKLTQKTLETSIDILGFSAPERM